MTGTSSIVLQHGDGINYAVIFNKSQTYGSAYSFQIQSIVDPIFDGISDWPTADNAIQLGDCNLEGVENFLDVWSFISILTAGDYLAEADINQDDMVDFFDIRPFIDLLISD